MSVPDSAAMTAAFRELELLVSIDVQRNETASLAHYILPGVLGLERDMLPWLTSGHTIKPFALWVDKVAEAPPGCREEWWIFDQLARRLDVVPLPAVVVDELTRLELERTPQNVFDLFLRRSPRGDLFGRRPEGWNRERAWSHPRGVVLADQLATGVLGEKLYTEDRRVHLDQPIMREALERHGRRIASAAMPLRLTSIRELRTCNTYLLNVKKLLAGHRGQKLRIHPTDAAVLAVRTGDRVTVRGEGGEIEVDVLVSDEMAPGNVGLPQGWGHDGGWRRANAAGGANYNRLTTNARDKQDAITGQAHLNGIEVSVAPARHSSAIGSRRGRRRVPEAAT